MDHLNSLFTSQLILSVTETVISDQNSHDLLRFLILQMLENREHRLYADDIISFSQKSNIENKK